MSILSEEVDCRRSHIRLLLNVPPDYQALLHDNRGNQWQTYRNFSRLAKYLLGSEAKEKIRSNFLKGVPGEKKSGLIMNVLCNCQN